MRLVEQWRRIGADLPADWAEARLALSVPRSDQRERAAALLSPASPGRVGDGLQLSIRRAGGGIGPDQATKLFGKLDEERIRGGLTVVETAERGPRPETLRQSLATAWSAALAELPRDWSDLYCELELGSSDQLDRAALLVAPINPARVPGRNAFRFRVARVDGYGASPQMTRRCLGRLDEEGTTGTVTVLRALSDTDNVDTQGPVWRVAGRAV
jgi:hypothetical protein